MRTILIASLALLSAACSPPAPASTTEQSAPVSDQPQPAANAADTAATATTTATTTTDAYQPHSADDNFNDTE